MTTLAPGIRHVARMVVEERHLVPNLDPQWLSLRDMPPVLATPMLVAFIEQTCADTIGPHLESGQQSVGVHVAVAHTAPTPLGMELTASATVDAVEGRIVSFRVECSDEVGKIADGTHQRAVVDAARFLERLGARAQGSKNSAA